ncbi:MAG: hypothetical protein AB1726_14865 [Planctomycetota bacterium]
MTHPPSPAPAPRRPRRLSWALKIPIGCASFLIGAVVVGILFLPWACGRAVRDELVASFNANYEGRLEVGQAWLVSLYGTQWVDDVELFDPEGELVLQARLRAPALYTLFAGERPDPATWGPVELTIERLHVRTDAAGRTNLARALTPRPGEGWNVRLGDRSFELHVSGGGQLPSESARVALRIAVERFLWTSPATLAAGRELRIDDLELEGSIAVSDRGLGLALAGAGDLPPESGSAARSARIAIKGGVEPVRTLAAGDAPPWHASLSIEGAAAADLDLLPAFGALEAAFGPRIDELRVDVDGERREARLAELVARSELASLRLSGARFAAGGLESGEDGDLAIDFPLGGWWTDELLRPLLPLCETLRAEDGAAGRLALSGFSIAGWGNLAAVAGDVRIDLPAARWALPGALSAALDPSLARAFRSPAGTIVARLEGRSIVFGEQTLSADGTPLAFTGRYDLAGDALALELAWPPDWPAPPGGATGVEGSLQAPAWR